MLQLEKQSVAGARIRCATRSNGETPTRYNRGQRGPTDCITAVCNIASNLSACIYKAWQDGDDSAKVMQAQLIKIRIAAQTFPFSAGLKTVLAHFTGLNAWRTVRPPLVALDDTQMTNLTPVSAVLLYGAGLLTAFSPCAMGLLPVTVAFLSKCIDRR